jgi:hypothetical protein
MSDQIEEQPAQNAQTSLQLADILNAVQIIQIASQRGAFKAEEFTQIGGVYDRLVSFLKDSGAIQPQSEEQAESAQPEGN